jgi:hypothetical protein
MKPQGFVPPSASPSAREAADLDVPIILRVAAVLAVAIVASILAVTMFFRHMERTYPDRTSEAEPRVTASDLPPLPRLQTDPLRDLQAVRAAEDAHLDRYGWIDRPHGIAQIPVERAMVLWVKSYAATPATNAAPGPATTELQMRQQKAQEGSHAP